MFYNRELDAIRCALRFGEGNFADWICTMGLDSYFLNNGGALDADKRLENLKLCGGILSGHSNDGSFRGKVYADFIQAVTDGDVSLYVEEQGPDAYAGVPAAIQDWLNENPGSGWTGNYSLNRQELVDLKTLFEVAQEQHAVLFGWW